MPPVCVDRDVGMHAYTVQVDERVRIGSLGSSRCLQRADLLTGERADLAELALHLCVLLVRLVLLTWKDCVVRLQGRPRRLARPGDKVLDACWQRMRMGLRMVLHAVRRQQRRLKPDGSLDIGGMARRVSEAILTEIRP